VFNQRTSPHLLVRSRNVASVRCQTPSGQHTKIEIRARKHQPMETSQSKNPRNAKELHVRTMQRIRLKGLLDV
jgi:hypothetical protein